MSCGKVGLTSVNKNSKILTDSLIDHMDVKNVDLFLDVVGIVDTDLLLQFIPGFDIVGRKFVILGSNIVGQ